MSIVIMKAVNGDEIIAKVIENSGETFKVSKPRILVMSHTSTGEVRPQIMPWIITAPDADVSINNSIMAVIPAPAEVERVYLQHTSGIELMSSSLQ